jgi:ubiquinol-cytochrome c reductase cytochrome c1 subunit
MRYNRLRDIGLTDQQIKDNLILTDAKGGRFDDHLHDA